MKERKNERLHIPLEEESGRNFLFFSYINADINSSARYTGRRCVFKIRKNL